MLEARFGKADIQSLFQGVSGLTKSWRSHWFWAQPHAGALPATVWGAVGTASPQSGANACAESILLEKCFT